MYLNLGDDPFILKHQGIIFSIASRYSTNPKDYEDLVSAGILGLLTARKTYRKNRQASFVTWAYIHVRSEIQKAKNSELLIKISPETARKSSIKIETYTSTFDKATYDNAYTILCDKEDEKSRIDLYKDVWIHLNNKFNSFERNIVLDYFVNNKSIRYLDAKYKTNSYKIISVVKDYIQGIYHSVSSSSMTSSSSGFFVY